MTQRVGLLNGTNITYDKDLTAGLLAILNQWVIEGLGISWSGASANVLPWKALIECIRTNGEKVMVFFENTANVAVDLTGTKKLYIAVTQAKIDDGSSNSLDGTGIGSIQTGASYPASNYIPLASITGGVITDASFVISKKALLAKWYPINKHKTIDETSWDEVLKDVSVWWSVLSTDIIRLKKASWVYEDIAFSVLQASLSPQAFSYWSRFYPIEDLLANDAIFEYVHPTVSQTINSYFNVWDVAGNTIVTLAKRISSWVSWNSITIRTDKVTPTANFWIRIVTCDASGVPTTTLVNANAVQFVAPASVSASWSNTVITFPGSFTCGTQWNLVAIQVCQGTSFASTTVNASQYYKVWMATGITDLSTELQCTASAGWSLVGAGTYSLSQSFTASRRCQVTKIEFWYSAGIGMNISISSGWKTWTKTLTVASTLVTLDAPFSIEAGKTVTISGSGASWSNWNAVTWGVTPSLDITASTGNGPWFVRLYSLFALDLPSTCTMVMDGFVKKSRALEIITSYVSWYCLWNTLKGTKPSFSNGFVPWFSWLSRIPYYVSTVAWLISWTDNLWAVWFWVSPTILDTDQNVLFRNSWAVRGLDGEIFFAGGSFRYVLTTAWASSATLKWAWDLANPVWQTIEAIGASVTVDKVINLPKWFLQLTYTWTVSTNQFHF